MREEFQCTVMWNFPVSNDKLSTGEHFCKNLEEGARKNVIGVHIYVALSTSILPTQHLLAEKVIKFGQMSFPDKWQLPILLGFVLSLAIFIYKLLVQFVNIHLSLYYKLGGLYIIFYFQEEKHLYRAIKFSEWCYDYTRDHEEHPPDRPLSLYEGISGPLYLLIDIQKPLEAKFPGFTL